MNLINALEFSEKLSILENINLEMLNREIKFSLLQKPTEEIIKTDSLNSLESLENSDSIVPLKVTGVFLKPGKPGNRYYSEEEIIKGIERSQAFLPLPIHYDHKDTETETMIGAITRLWFDSTTKSAHYAGHINDERAARNVLDGIIKEISATIMSRRGYDEINGVAGEDLVFTEISTVRKGAEPNNSLEVVA